MRPTSCKCQLCILAAQGIYNLPNCQTDEDDPRDKPTAMCLTVQRLVAAGAYLPFIRHATLFLRDCFRFVSSCVLYAVMQAVQVCALH